MGEVKIVITGPVGVGKTTFVRSVSQTPVVETEEVSSVDIGKSTTTVALDFGTVRVKDVLIRLFGTPGQERFSFMWEDLMEGATGFIFLVDSSDPDSFPWAKRMLQFYTSNYDTPFIVGATKQDLEDVWTPEEIAEYFGLPKWAVRGVVSTDGESARSLLVYFFEILAQKGGGRWID